jgi:hypothetical protein
LKGNRLVITDKSNLKADNCGNLGAVFSLQACSACAGDYEDPDRTAGEDFEELLEEHEEVVMERQVVDQAPMGGSIFQRKEEHRS